MKICPVCGERLGSSATLCSNCGSRVQSAAQDAYVPQPLPIMLPGDAPEEIHEEHIEMVPEGMGQEDQTSHYEELNPTPDMMFDWTCPKCKKVCHGRFCSGCGSPFMDTTWLCPGCGHLNYDGCYCENCGQRGLLINDGTPFGFD